MNTSHRLATLTVLALVGGWLITGCAGSSEQTTSDDQAASSDGDASVVSCKKLEAEANQETGESDDSGDSPKLPLKATGPVATLDGQKISADDFNRFARKRMPTQHRKMPKPLADRMKRKMTQKLVEQRLIARTLDEASVSIKQSELESRFLDFKSRFPDKQALQAFLDQRNTTKPQLKAQLCRDVQMEKYLEQKYNKEVGDDEVADYYENNQSEFETPAKVKASHILIRVPKDASPKQIEKTKKKAKNLAKKARKKKVDFAKLAKKHSEGPSAKRGGNLGFFSQRRMVPEFSKVAFSMKPGEVSDPVRTKFGFHVIKMHDKKEAKAKSLDEARGEIERRLRQQNRRTSMNRFLKDAKKDASI
ncbi:MAG: peptidylprolyl isomerase, partial [Bradymonadaceae bacterium]